MWRMTKTSWTEMETYETILEENMMKEYLWKRISVWTNIAYDIIANSQQEGKGMISKEDVIRRDT